MRYSLLMTIHEEVATIRPVEVRTPSAVMAGPLADQVFTTLRGWIVEGRLPPGYRLRVRELAASVGTSVQPVRDAIMRLVETGLVVQEPYKGARVRGLEVSELQQAYDVRILIEGECARLGALAASPGVADRMQAHWEELQKAVAERDVIAALQQDELLLGALYAAADNEVLVEVINGLWDKCRPYKLIWAGGATGDGDLSMWHYKPELIAAVRHNDGAEAERIMRTSYNVAKAAIRATLARNQAK